MDRENGAISGEAISEQYDRKSSSLHAGNAFIPSSTGGLLEPSVLGAKGGLFSTHGEPTEIQREETLNSGF